MARHQNVEETLKAEATRISRKFGGAPVVVVVGGSTMTAIPRTTTASSVMGEDVLPRDLLGLLQMSIQMESWKQFRKWEEQPNLELNPTRAKAARAA
jgi:hypothetical protein